MAASPMYKGGQALKTNNYGDASTDNKIVFIRNSSDSYWPYQGNQVEKLERSNVRAPLAGYKKRKTVLSPNEISIADTAALHKLA